MVHQEFVGRLKKYLNFLLKLKSSLNHEIFTLNSVLSIYLMMNEMEGNGFHPIMSVWKVVFERLAYKGEKNNTDVHRLQHITNVAFRQRPTA
jgi:hypothetical protein